MRLTKREALEICKELWEWLVKTGGCNKKLWPGWGKYGIMRLECPCCEYVKQSRRVSGVACALSHCPLRKLWPRPRYSEGDEYGCEYLTSPYRKWCNAINAKERRKYARQIVKGCIKALAKLPKRKKTKRLAKNA